jgi:hypothetical protein
MESLFIWDSSGQEQDKAPAYTEGFTTGLGPFQNQTISIRQAKQEGDRMNIA